MASLPGSQSLTVTGIAPPSRKASRPRLPSEARWASDLLLGEDHLEMVGRQLRSWFGAVGICSTGRFYLRLPHPEEEREP